MIQVPRSLKRQAREKFGKPLRAGDTKARLLLPSQSVLLTLPDREGVYSVFREWKCSLTKEVVHNIAFYAQWPISK